MIDLFFTSYLCCFVKQLSNLRYLAFQMFEGENSEHLLCIDSQNEKLN